WTLRGLKALDAGQNEAIQAVLGALDHRSDAVRRNALAALPAETRHLPKVLERLGDADALVRQAALLFLADAPANDQAGSAIL
ncbi:MAG: hypothetical protein NZO58_08325, partial [Gemmataceae bacterium]|nr:hypothetical protein [Gemmataceae bacterium]